MLVLIYKNNLDHLLINNKYNNIVQVNDISKGILARNIPKNAAKNLIFFPWFLYKFFINFLSVIISSNINFSIICLF